MKKRFNKWGFFKKEALSMDLLICFLVPGGSLNSISEVSTHSSRARACFWEFCTFISVAIVATHVVVVIKVGAAAFLKP